jgi:hypothetical protein
MRFQITLFAGLISILLAACGGDPGGHNPYDGAWTASYDTGITNTADSVCSVPTASITLTNGAGSYQQIETCQLFTIISSVAQTTTVATDLLTSVAISGQGIKAIVNGNTFSGNCVSQNGCSAQADAGGKGSMTLIR